MTLLVVFHPAGSWLTLADWVARHICYSFMWLKHNRKINDGWDRTAWTDSMNIESFICHGTSIKLSMYTSCTFLFRYFIYFSLFPIVITVTYVCVQLTISLHLYEAWNILTCLVSWCHYILTNYINYISHHSCDFDLDNTRQIWRWSSISWSQIVKTKFCSLIIYWLVLSLSYRSCCTANNKCIKSPQMLA